MPLITFVDLSFFFICPSPLFTSLLTLIFFVFLFKPKLTAITIKKGFSGGGKGKKMYKRFKKLPVKYFINIMRVINSKIKKGTLIVGSMQREVVV